VWSRLVGLGRVHHREHHIGNRHRRPAEVRLQVLVRLVISAVDVPQHGVDELVDFGGWDVVFVGDAVERGHHGVVAVDPSVGGLAHPFEFPALLGRRTRSGSSTTSSATRKKA